MASFSYRAVNAQGQSLSGSIAAERIEFASRELKAQGLTLLSLAPESQSAANNSSGSAAGFSADSEEILSFTRELSVLLRAGLPIDRALKVMIDMASSDVLKGLLSELLSSVKAGKGLSQALVAYPGAFSNFYVNMVRSGEASGHLDSVLERLADYLTNAKAVRSSVKSALIYPAILLVVAVLSIVGMLTFVIPQFESLFNDMGDALPGMTRVVLNAAQFLQSYGWVLVILLVLAFLITRNYFRTEVGRKAVDGRLLRLPLIGDIVFKYEMSMFAKTVGTLLGNGVSLLQAIAIAVETVDNSFVKSHLMVLEPAVKRGQRMSVALQEADAFSPLVVQMVRVGEESGSLDTMMLELAQVYDEEVQAGVNRSLTLLEPVLILTMGVVIAAIILAILMGIMSVNQLAI